MKNDDINDFIGGDDSGAELAAALDDPDPENLPVDDRATELANAEEVAREHGINIHWDATRGKFLIYNGQCWADDIGGQVTRYVKNIARMSSDRLRETVRDPKTIEKFRSRMESAAGVNGVLALLKTEPGITVTADDLDKNEFLLPCLNGALDLRSAKLRPHDRSDLVTRCLRTSYHPDAVAPLWLAFLDRIMASNAEMIGYLQRLFGVCLTGTGTVHELFIPYGVGANGKSVFFDTMMELLCEYAGLAPESLMVSRNGHSEHPTELADLKGLRVVIGSETEAGAVLRLQQIKRLTGDAMIKGRFMRQDFFEFKRTHKMILITNNRPRLTESTEAVWRRLRVIPFKVVIPLAERDPLLLEKLRAEFPGILAWAVRGCLDWQRNGMNPPSEVLVATDDYREEADELAEFISAKCITGDVDTFRAERGELFGSYTSWAKSSNERRPMERAQFYEAIRRRDGIREDRWKVSGVAVRGFQGIGLSGNGSEQ